MRRGATQNHYVIPRSALCVRPSRDLIFAKRLLCEAEVALTCQKSRYLDARTYNAVRGMTIFFLMHSALRAMTIFRTRRAVRGMTIFFLTHSALRAMTIFRTRRAVRGMTILFFDATFLPLKNTPKKPL